MMTVLTKMTVMMVYTCGTRSHLPGPPRLDARQEVRLGAHVTANDRQVKATLDNRVLDVTDIRTTDRYTPHNTPTHLTHTHTPQIHNVIHKCLRSRCSALSDITWSRLQSRTPLLRHGPWSVAWPDHSIKFILLTFAEFLSRRSRQREWLNALALSICSSVRLSACPSVSRQNEYKKHDFLKKLSNLELWSLLTTYRKSYMSFSKNPLLGHKIQDGGDPSYWKLTFRRRLKTHEFTVSYSNIQLL